MLWLIKWIILIFFAAGIWFCYDFVTNLSSSEKEALKTEIIEVIDGDNYKAGPMLHKAKDDFIYNIKYSIKKIIYKVLD
jgi:hypothetical protein